MDINDFIKHARTWADENRAVAKVYFNEDNIRSIEKGEHYLDLARGHDDIANWLEELKEARIRLSKIEAIARDAFNDPDTQDINLYRAQKLADIFAIFEYDGATIKED